MCKAQANSKKTQVGRVEPNARKNARPNRTAAMRHRQGTGRLWMQGCVWGMGFASRPSMVGAASPLPQRCDCRRQTGLAHKTSCHTSVSAARKHTAVVHGAASTDICLKQVQGVPWRRLRRSPRTTPCCLLPPANNRRSSASEGGGVAAARRCTSGFGCVVWCVCVCGGERGHAHRQSHWPSVVVASAVVSLPLPGMGQDGAAGVLGVSPCVWQ